MIETIDVILRTVVVMTAVILSVLLFRASGRYRAAVPGALFSLAVAAFFVTSAGGASLALGAWAWPLTALCVTKAVWFWLLIRALFDDDAVLERRHILIAAAVAGAGSWQQLVFLADYRAGSAGTLETIAGVGFDAALLGFVLLGLREMWRDMDVDLLERRRRLRLVFIVGTGAYLALALVVQTRNLLLGVPTPVLATWANMAIVTGVFLGAAWQLLQLRASSWLDPSRPAEQASLSPVETAVKARLERAMAEERVYLREGLTIGGLAAHLRTGEHVLRRVIHHGLGYRNFNDFLHAWRIREACEALSRPELARQPVLSIAMDVGYGSIGAFNRAFKAQVGMTPTDFRRSNCPRATPAR